MTLHAFRFGVITETFRDPRQLQSLACTVEKIGFSTLLIRDHLAPDYFGPQFAPLPTLAFLAASTGTLRLGTMVVSNDFRHPTMLAKEVATLDVLSNGRFELGVGAGWLASEYAQTGMAYDRNGVRIDRLEESLQILRRCFTGEPVTFTGTHYQVSDYTPFPVPAQGAGLPLFVGAGQPRMLQLAGKYADTVGLLTVSVSSGEMREDVVARRTAAVRERIGHVRAGAGERAAQVELSLVPDVHITDNRATGLDTVITRNRWNGLDRAAVEDMPAIFVGTIGQICDQMVERRADLGISYYVIPDDMLATVAPIVERLSGC